jgi:hypothetical protein
MKKVIVNVDGSTIEMELSAEELGELASLHSEYLARKNKIDIEQEAAEIKRKAAEAKLAALGLTSDDLKALGLGGN